MTSSELRQLTSPEVDERAATTLLVPLGSVEQHGPHLPLDTDSRIALALAHGIADRLGDALVAPVVAFGSSGEHAGFAGTLSIGTDTLRAVLLELARSNDSFMHLVFVNGHGGNLEVLAVSASTPGGDAHAGRTETSLMLAIAPDTVRLDRAEPGATSPIDELLPVLRAGGVLAVSPNGVLGDPTGANAEEGHALLQSMISAQSDRIAAALDRGRPPHSRASGSSPTTRCIDIVAEPCCSAVRHCA